MALIAISSNNATAQGTLHDKTLYEVVRQTPAALNESAHIDVGDNPRAIDVSGNTVYVANTGSNKLEPSTVSVISAENNTKIKDIPVGDTH